MYTTIDDFRLVVYIESDWAGSVDDRKSTLGYAFNLGLGGISWAAKKKSIFSFNNIR